MFYEQFSAVGNQFELIPKATRAPGELTPSTNDFRWLDRDVLVELKSFEKPRQRNVSAEIQRSVLAARERSVVKNNFIVYSRRYPPTEGFLKQMRQYNMLHPDAQIDQLFWWSGDSLVQIDLL